jgi:hypothetical protein
MAKVVVIASWIGCGWLIERRRRYLIKRNCSEQCRQAIDTSCYLSVDISLWRMNGG